MTLVAMIGCVLGAAIHVHAQPQEPAPANQVQISAAEQRKLTAELAKEARKRGEKEPDPFLVTGAMRTTLGRGSLADIDDKIKSKTGGATFTWRVHDRYEDSWKAWEVRETLDKDDPQPHTEQVYGYDPSFVHPNEWEVELDGCGTNMADGPSLRFSWIISRDGRALFDRQNVECSFHTSLPHDGRYDVTMEVVSSGGSRETLSAAIDVRDIVIVSLGDSAASGEGNPDDAGYFDNDWMDRRCHRSRNSGHALVGEAMEKASAQSSVTFLSFACSGAKLESGVLTPYAGIVPLSVITLPPSSVITPPPWWPGFPVTDLPSQVAAAREALCSVPIERCRQEDMRRPDYVFVTIGVNDLKFADIVTLCGDLTKLSLVDLILPIAIIRRLGDDSCISRETEGELSSGVTFLESHTDNVFRIPCDLTDAEWQERFGFVPLETPPFCTTNNSGTFGELRRRLEAAGLMPTRGVYVTTYPAEPFSANNGDIKDGCGIFFSISKDEAQFMSHWGHKLNTTIHGEAVGNGFFSVPGITKAFRKHGYCAGKLETGMVGPDGQRVVVGSDSYFVGLTESITNQSGIHGTIHPNRLGHEAIRDATLTAIAAKKPDRRPTHRVTVIVERIRFDTPPGNDIKVSGEFSAMPLEPSTTDEDDADFRGVSWKQVLEFRDFDAVPGQWLSFDTPLRLHMNVAPSDVRLSFSAFAKLRWTPKTIARERGQGKIPGENQPRDPGGEVGGAGFYLVQYVGKRSDDARSYGAGSYRRRGDVDKGLNEGSMSVEFCVVVAPIQSGPLHEPSDVATLSCPPSATRK